MVESKFIQFLKGFALVVAKIYDNILGKPDEQGYAHKALFREEYSVDGKWSSVSGDTSNITADYVALDSSLPLKRRGAISKVDGDIPKMGMKLALNENRMKEYLILIALGKITELVRKIYDDVRTVIVGVEENLEYASFQAISTGQILVTDDEKPGIGVRVDYGIPSDNRFGVELAWTDPNAKPLEDIQRMLDYAQSQGYSPSVISMDKATANLLLNNDSVKEFYGAYQNFQGTSYLRPNKSQLNEALSADKGVNINVVNRTVKFQRDGVNTVKNVWHPGKVVLHNSGVIGTLAYTDLAEETFKAEQVTYAKAGSYTLVSKWHNNDPVKEYTSSQAAVLPVIQDVRSLYHLDTNDVPTSVSAQTEGDANMTIDGNVVSRSAVITALNDVGVSKASDRNTDATLQKYFNDLSAEDEATVRTALGI